MSVSTFLIILIEPFQDAKKARAAMTDKEFHGRRIRVDFSISKGPHQRTPGSVPLTTGSIAFFDSFLKLFVFLSSRVRFIVCFITLIVI